MKHIRPARWGTSPLTIIFIYLALAVSWILISDAVLHHVAADLEHSTQLQTWKGLAFVVTSAVVLYYLIHRYRRELERSQTARQQVEHELESSQGLLTGLMANLPGMAYRCRHGADGTMELVSDGCAALTGYPAAQFLSGAVSYRTLTHPEDRAKVDSAIKRALEAGKSFAISYRILTASGATRWVWEQGRKAVHAPDGATVVEGFITDITSAKLNELRLIQSEERFRKLIENTTDIIAVMRSDGIAAFVSPSTSRILGYELHELTGSDILHLVHPDDLAEVLAALQGMFAQNYEPETLEFRVRHKDGSWRCLEGIGELLEEDGQAALLVNARDITDRKQAELAHLRLATAVEQATEAVVITDAEGHIEYVNPAFETMTGYSAGEVLGKTPSILKSGRHAPAFYEHLWGTIRRGEKWHGRLTNKKKDGTLFDEETIIFPMRDSSNRIVNFVSIKRDITRELRFESHLQQSQKLEAIGTLAGGIAHDFNNILSAMLGYTELAAADLPPESRIRRDLDEVMKAGRRAKDLIRQILTFSRQAEHEKAPLRLDGILRDALKLLRPTLPSTLKIEETVQPDCEPVLANATQIHQVVMNLCTNAYHAMRDSGGTLRLGLAQITLEAEDAAENPDLRPGRYVRITVSDTGSGIDPAALDRIFEPFFTTKGKDEGTGLGLSTAHGIVRSHGGAITVYSEVGRGTTFHVYLPCVPEPATLAPAEEAPPVHGHGEVVLFIDDEDALVRLGKQMLERINYRVSAWNSSTAALAAFEANPGAFDIVLTDQTMPSMTGYELAQRIRQVRADIPIIITTGFSEGLSEERAAAAGITAVVLKPLVARELARLLQSALERG